MNNSSVSTPIHINSLTPLRGIAALWVVLFHADVCLYYRDLGALIDRDASGIFSRGYLWVDFFFLLSGFIIAHVYGDRLRQENKWFQLKCYLLARFSRLYPLHFFTLSVLVVGSLVAGSLFPVIIDGSWNTYFSWSALPSNLLFLNAMNQHVYLSWNIVSWSIGAEWWTYVAAIGLIISLRGKPLGLIALVALFAFTCLIYLVYQFSNHNLDITYSAGFIRCFFEFAIGLCLYEAYSRACAQKYLSADAVFALLMVFVLLIFHFKWADLSVIPVFSLLILAAAYNSGRIKVALAWPPFQYLGTISYSIYLMHGIWFMFFWFGFPQWKAEYSIGELSVLFKAIYLLLFVGLTIGSAHFSYRYIEVPGRRLLRKHS